MSRRISRALKRIATFRRFVYLGGAIVVGYSPKILAFVGIDRILSVMPAIFSGLAKIGPIALSPYFPLAIVAIAIIVLFGQALPIKLSTRAEFLVETIEERIGLARALLKKPHISLIEWKTWEEQTVIDLSHYVSPMSVDLRLFRLAGEPTTHEYESDDTWHRHALSRQLRMLNELIDRIDSGEFQKRALQKIANASD